MSTRLDLTYRGAVLAARAAMRALRVDVRVEGGHHVPRRGPAILVTNHASYLDFLFLGVPAHRRGRRVRFLCRDQIWNTSVAGVMNRMGHVPVDRDAPAGAYLQARRHLRAGELVGVFPEAGISYSFTVRAMMQGAAALARETGAPIVPGAMWGAQRLWTVGQTPYGTEPPPTWHRDRVVDVRLAAPLHVRADDDPAEVTRDLGRRITAMLEETQQRPHHLPRPGEYAPWHPAHLGGDALTPEQARDLDLFPRRAIAPVWGPTAPSRPADPAAPAAPSAARGAAPAPAPPGR